jgi:hypothetical protein
MQTPRSVRGAISDGRPYRDTNPPDRTIRTGGLSSRKRGFWKLPKILGRSLSPGFSGQAIEFLHILRIGIGPALLSERGKKLFG